MFIHSFEEQSLKAVFENCVVVLTNKRPRLSFEIGCGFLLNYLQFCLIFSYF